MPQPCSRVKLLMGVLLNPPLPAMAAMAAIKAIRVKSTVGRTPRLNQETNRFSTLGPSGYPSPVQVLVFHQLPPGTPLLGVRPAVAIGVDGRLQPLFDHVQMAVPIPILAGVQPSVAVAVLAAEDGNGSGT